MALPRAQRVRHTAEFALIRERGRSFAGRLLTLAVLSLPEEKHARFGFTVTRRLGNAVMRNKVRRRLRAIAASLAPLLSPPHLIVTIPRQGAANANFTDLKAEWTKLARRAGLLPAA
jgi:ribonuclease P protein component